MEAKALLGMCVAAVAVVALILGSQHRKGRRQAGSDSRAAARAAPAEVTGASQCCPARKAPGAARARPGVGASEKLQVACPVTGKAVDRDICIIHLGKCIYFCSKACASEFAKEPGAHMKRLERQDVELSDASECRHLKR